MKSLRTAIALAFILAAASASAQNLVQNGSFETLPAGESLTDHWAVLSALPGWTVAANGVEVQRGLFGFDAADGSVYVELDTYHPSSIWQDIQTHPDALYDLIVAYRTRPDAIYLSDQDGGSPVQVTFGEGTLDFSSATAGATSGWVYGQVRVQASADVTTLKIADKSPDNMYGGLIDDVRVNYVGCMVDGTALLDPIRCDTNRACSCSPTPGWRNHGAYVSCVSDYVDALSVIGAITADEMDAIVSAAARSSCGKKE